MAEELSEKSKRLAKEIEERMKNDTPSRKKFREMKQEARYGKFDIAPTEKYAVKLHLNFEDLGKKYELPVSSNSPITKDSMGPQNVTRSLASADSYFNKGKPKEAALAALTTLKNYNAGMARHTSFDTKVYRNKEPGEEPIKIYEAVERRLLRYVPKLVSTDPELARFINNTVIEIEKARASYRKK